MLDFYDNLRKQYENKLPFVVFSKPNSERIVALLQNDVLLHEIKDFTENGFAFVSFDGTKKYYIPSENASIFVTTNVNSNYYWDKNKIISTDFDSKSAYENLVQSGVEAIKNGQFGKVILSRKEIVAVPDLDIIDTFNYLVTNYSTAFAYCFYHPEIGLWIGATPEQFLKMENSILNTVALAGTQLFAENCIWETKEKEEQQFVTQFIVESLHEYCDAISVSEPYTFQAGSIAHIKTDIQATLKNENDLGKVIELLHPTPAVCGYPKAIAKEFIIKNEGYDRTFYTGFLGELNIDLVTAKKNTSNLFVNLRCMNIVKDNANLYLGCGITKDSIPEKEFEETVNKSMTMKRSIN